MGFQLQSRRHRWPHFHSRDRSGRHWGLAHCHIGETWLLPDRRRAECAPAGGKEMLVYICDEADV